jgi:hypothetical protein
MRTTRWFGIVVLTVAAGAPACTAPAGQPTPEASAPATVISAAVQQQWQAARRNVAESADVMGEENYGFRPVESVRTFGQILAHLAGANYVFCSAARGEPSPHAEAAFEETAKTKADIVRVLGESLTYCDGVYQEATDASLAQTVAQPFGQGDGPRAAVLISNIGHLNEHYGNLVTYFRIKDIVPPSSRR